MQTSLRPILGIANNFIQCRSLFLLSIFIGASAPRQTIPAADRNERANLDPTASGFREAAGAMIRKTEDIAFMSNAGLFLANANESLKLRKLIRAIQTGPRDKSLPKRNIAVFHCVREGVKEAVLLLHRCANSSEIRFAQLAAILQHCHSAPAGSNFGFRLDHKLGVIDRTCDVLLSNGPHSLLGIAGGFGYPTVESLAANRAAIAVDIFATLCRPFEFRIGHT